MKSMEGLLTLRMMLLLWGLAGLLTVPEQSIAASADPDARVVQQGAVMLRYRKVFGAAPGDDQRLEITVYQSGRVDAHYPSFFRYPGRHQFRLSVTEIQQLRMKARQLPNLDQPGWLRLTRQADSAAGGEFRVIADQDITEIWFDRDDPNKSQSRSKPFYLLADGLNIRARDVDADPQIRQMATVDSGIWTFINRRIVGEAGQ